jgi:hypothetical protein
LEVPVPELIMAMPVIAKPVGVSREAVSRSGVWRGALRW